MNDNLPIILLLGGANTGKSNYIVGLWLAINSNLCRLTKGRLPENLEYLESEAQRLLGAEFVSHTPSGSTDEIVIPFKLADEQDEGSLLLPNYSGEDLERMYFDREWPQFIEEKISNCIGCMLFIRDDVKTDPLSWFSVGEAVLKSPPTSETYHNYEPENETPTQTILVELLQFFQDSYIEYDKSSNLPKFAIIISAWDDLPKNVQELGPSEYLMANDPLLYQFLNANKKEFDFQVFGVSTVGGNFKEDEEFRDKYLEGEPISLGYTTYEKDQKIQLVNDITLPIAWIFGTPLEF